MSLDSRLGGRLRSTADHRTFLLALPLAAASIVCVTYLVTHPYPAYGAGLFLQTAEQISAHGYGLPARIPGYTADGIPFAYPPLAFYVLSVLVHGVGVDPIAVTRYLPALLVVACLLPYYAIAAELMESPRRATLATVLFATAPAVLKWHISAGGVVRAMAFLIALTSIYAGLRLFRSHAPRWVAIGAITFSLVVLTHPTYASFVVVSYLVIFAALDRSPRGLGLGAVVGVGGLVLVAPWWLHVAGVHGFEIFFTAAGTHGGLGAGLVGFLSQLTDPLTRATVHWPFYALVYIGSLYAVWRRRWFLPAWLLVAAFVVSKNRFLFVPGTILAATFVYDVLLPWVRDRAATPSVRRTGPTVVVGIVVVAAVITGTVYGAGAVAGLRGDSPAQPQFMDAADDRAMEWTAGETPQDATFVVLGDTAEWFPALTERTMLVGPWGVEWKSTSGYYTQYARHHRISTCPDAACVAATLDRAGVQPDYVYVSKGQYTVFGKSYVQDPSMTASLASSERFRVVFENDGVVITAFEGQ